MGEMAGNTGVAKKARRCVAKTASAAQPVESKPMVTSWEPNKMELVVATLPPGGKLD